MGIVSELRALLSPAKQIAKRGDAARVIEIESALTELAKARATANAAIIAASDRRRALLLADATDDQITALESETVRQGIVLERLELLEAELLEQLQAARTGARRAAWSELRTRWHATVPAYVKAMREASAARDKLLAISTESHQQGFYNEALASFEPPPFMLNDVAQLDAFEAVVERHAERAANTRQAVPARPVPPVVAPAAPVAPPKRPVAPPPGPMQIKRTRQPSPVAGGVRVRVLREGYENHEGVPCIVNEIIELPPEMARGAAMNGAVDIVKEEAA